MVADRIKSTLGTMRLEKMRRTGTIGRSFLMIRIVKLFVPTNGGESFAATTSQTEAYLDFARLRIVMSRKVWQIRGSSGFLSLDSIISKKELRAAFITWLVCHLPYFLYSSTFSQASGEMRVVKERDSFLGLVFFRAVIWYLLLRIDLTQPVLSDSRH